MRSLVLPWIVFFLSRKCFSEGFNNFEGNARLNLVILNLTILLSDDGSIDCLQIMTPQHLTDSRKETIHTFLDKSDMTTGLYTFQQYVKRKKGKSWKVSCYKPMKVMFGDAETKAGFDYLSHEIRTTGSLWLLFLNSSANEFLESAKLPFDIELLVADVRSENLILLKEAYRVKEGFPLRMPHYGKWTKEEGLDAIVGSIYTRRFDLEGVVLKTASIENWPTSYLTPSGWDGYFPQIWKQIEGLINSSSIAFQSVDGTTGTKNPDGTWNGLVGMAVRGEIDVILSELSMNKPRSHVLDYFRPLIRTNYQVYYHELGNKLEWTSFFKPFGRAIWLCIVLLLLTGSVAMSFCYYVSLLYGFENDQDNMFSPVRSFFFMLQSLCQQGYPDVPRSTACKILFFTSYLASAVLIPSYSASLISSLTQQTPYRPFDSLKEMLSDGTYRLLVRNNTAERSYFEDSENKLLLEVLEKLIKTVPKEHEMVNTQQALENVCRLPKYALFGIEAIMNIRIASVFKLKCNVITLTQPLSRVYLTMGLAKGSPYSALINHFLHQLAIFGIIKRIEMDVWPQNKRNPAEVHTQVNPEDVFLMFVITGAFVVISLTLLFCEKMMFKYRAKRQVGERKNTQRTYNWYYSIEIYV